MIIKLKNKETELYNQLKFETKQAKNMIGEQYNFSNPLHFPNPNSLIDYWKSYHLYDPSLEDKFIININIII